MTKRLYDQVVAICQDYLGPAADRFVERIVASHLKKTPESLTSEDLPKLSEWLKVSIGLLTEDKTTVDDCERRILKLSTVNHGH
jgi:hypothetical protein